MGGCCWCDSSSSSSSSRMTLMMKILDNGHTIGVKDEVPNICDGLAA